MSGLGQVVGSANATIPYTDMKPDFLYCSFHWLIACAHILQGLTHSATFLLKCGGNLDAAQEYWRLASCFSDFIFQTVQGTGLDALC
ncbi:hypothetical protein EA58_11135 [Photobacterium galatheae]|uniref:Uncharacterized protein n=1 Tax=Photobacterium galatheae TaxID=1654360 RepID=A0A066RMA0_9GAMM|nr:hypothetical protein EA58_11135 [Photobacterium galatheae]